MPATSQVEIVVCPVCSQKLALQAYMVVGTRVVCANRQCNTTLRVTKRNPIQVERLTAAQTRNPDSSPESYG
jgi:uncharacterized protein YbaR (Trm112 family)